MADDIDRANEYTQRLNDEALSNRKRYTGHSASHCIDCGEPIPESRRFAVLGCQTCVECAGIRERRL